MYNELRSRLDRGETVLLDGAMGSELVRRGVRWRKHGLETDAESVEALHGEYLAAGADILRTNTFQLNPRLYLHVFRDLEHMRQIGAPGLEHLVPKLQKTAVALAKRARTKAGADGKVAIAGMISPIEHCYRPDLSPPYETALREHQPMAEVFAAEKVDFLLAESMNTIHEAKAALAAGRAAKLPVWVSFVIGPEGELLSREPLADAVAEMEKGGAEAVLVSNAPPADITRAAGRMKGFTKVPFGAFAHIGRFSPPSWKFDFHPQFIDTEAWPPAQYQAEARGWKAAGARIVGGCCGTTPAHTRVLGEWLGRR
ncbi:MAG TPA: homocysteine S-methyltransferase family protein [Candidatus Acidoferrales bacterium]|nr:homocysteine S-methyltransferase family protein [Candidatus Acidoferrales bacterium]